VLFVVAGIGVVSQLGAQDTAWVKSKTGLAYAVIAKGTGPVATRGQSVSIHEITSLTNGTVIFDSYAKKTPVTFLLGGNQVIAGVEEGVTGMRVGEKRVLVVPPSLSARSAYPPNTPKDSTLRIAVELVGIKPN
jgi:FKBP-type peptidyl-prolyl cis-trans isomerase